MIEKKITNYFAIGALLIIVHKIESYLTGEYLMDPAYGIIATLLSEEKNVYIALILLLFTIFLFIYLVSLGTKFAHIVFIIAGILFTHEIHHLIRSFIYSTYYPGTATGLVCFFFSFFYWKCLLSKKLDN